MMKLLRIINGDFAANLHYPAEAISIGIAPAHHLDLPGGSC